MGTQVDYGPLDRLLHRLAFASPALQLTAADVERTLCGRQYKDVAANRPVLVTSLPRAGTTLLLGALGEFPALASHSYRDMPFVLAPLLWARIGGGFQKRGELRERAHGDGMQIGYDSAEALEEVVWRALGPKRYETERLALWSADELDETGCAFVREHFRKIVVLRCPGRADGRYLSKNNGNIARLDLLVSAFPDADLVVPFRAPLEHAASLLRQHRNFLDLHAAEPFVRRYMADLGHFEFGALHRPVAFPCLDQLTEGRDPLGLDYWLGYWIAAFEHVLARKDRVILLSYEALCTAPRRGLERLCRRLVLPDEGALEAAAARFRSVPAPRAAAETVDPALRARAEALHAALRAADGITRAEVAPAAAE